MIVYVIHPKDKCGVNETKKSKKGEAIFLSQAICLTTFYIAGIFLNSEKKERREAQLAKKAETIKAFASEVILQSPTQMLIDGRPYFREELSQWI